MTTSTDTQDFKLVERNEGTVQHGDGGVNQAVN